MKVFLKLTMTSIFCLSFVNADYLESLLKSKQEQRTKVMSARTEKVTVADKNITSDEALSRVLLSFEKEAEEEMKMKRLMAEKRKAEAAKQQAENERRRAAEAAESAMKNKKNKHFPTLEEQMENFNGRDEKVVRSISADISVAGGIAVRNKQIIYGVFCKKGRCYALGNQRVYKEGDVVNGRKIMEIGASFIRYKDGGKEWYTR